MMTVIMLGCVMLVMVAAAFAPHRGEFEVGDVYRIYNYSEKYMSVWSKRYGEYYSQIEITEITDVCIQYVQDGETYHVSEVKFRELVTSFRRVQGTTPAGVRAVVVRDARRVAP